MFKKILTAFAGALSLAVCAQPVSFTSVSFETSALALAQGQTNGQSSSSATNPLPLLSVATAVGLDDFANAAAVGNSGLLTAVTSVDSLAGAASADAYSRFIGSFAGGGAFSLSLNFTTTNTLDLGTGSGALFVLLTNTVGNSTTTLFNGVYTQSASEMLSYNLPAGSTSMMNLFLVSGAASTGANQTAENFSQLAFGASVVPEPAVWLLLSMGLAMTVARRVVSERKAARR